MILNPQLFLVSLLGIGFGGYWFVLGFREIKSRRIIQDIATSRIATGAVGTQVEIKGKVESQRSEKIPAPVSGFDCYFYSIEIQRLVKTRNSSYWKKLDQFYSSPGFFIDDGSGARAFVLVEGAEIIRSGGVRYLQSRSNRLDELPVSLKQALAQNQNQFKRFRFKNTSWLLSQEYRFVEWRFSQGQKVYVMGFADSGITPPKRIKIKFEQFLKARKLIQTNPKLQKKFDSNQDGVLDSGELEVGAKRVAQHWAVKEATTEPKNRPQAPRMIFRKKPGCPFIISDQTEHHLVREMGMKAGLKVFGGPVIALISGLYLMMAIIKPSL